VGILIEGRGATIAFHAPVAQLDRASVFGTEGWGFESLRARFAAPGAVLLAQSNPHVLGVRDARPRVVILGAGFGGLFAARALRRAPVRLTVVDRRNYHLFQPLLYQVAGAALSPADIAAPIRHILRRQANTTVLLGEATGVDTPRRAVMLADRRLEYDYLIVATGAANSYFGHEDWRSAAPGLKDVEDALEIRRRLLLAFEAAEWEADPERRRAELTFIVIGGGPTGVELAGMLCEIARRAIPKDFRAIDTKTARIILVEANDRVLTSMPGAASRRALADLQRLGVEVRLNTRVTEIDRAGVIIGPAEHPERIEARNVIWAAGVRASRFGELLGVPLDRSGRVEVNPDLTIPGHPEVFVVGDLARVADPVTGRDVPGVAQGGIQMGRYAARIIAAEVRQRSRDTGARGAAPVRAPFRYKDLGTMATIGRNKAVAHIWGMTFGGVAAWLLWALIHVVQLIEFRDKVIVMIEWAWAYFTFQRGARLITGEPGQAAPGTVTGAESAEKA
jgi:NADH:ubiquinone reductase (H+-translocating)